MNREEAGRVLAFMMAPYQGEPLVADGAEAWFHSALESREFTEAMGVARMLVGASEFRPTPASFNQAWRQRAVRPPEFVAIERAPDPNPGSVAAIIAELRTMLATQGARQHNHKGPGRCPVCGGIDPKVLEAQRFGGSVTG